MNENISLLGVPTHWGVGITDLTRGPSVFRDQGIIEKLKGAGFNITDEGDIDCQPDQQAKIHDKQLKYVDQVVDVSRKTATKVSDIVQNGHSSLIIGGDHSLAIGAVSGASQAIDGTLGLLYIDEHGDLNTHESTESGNIHGMALAALIGYGNERLVHAGSSKVAVSKENAVHIGGAELDRFEYELIEQEHIEAYQLADILRHGWQPVFEAIDRLAERTNKIWVSIDLDSINDDTAPGVTMPDKNGLLYREIALLTRYIGEHCDVVGASIAEYNDTTDIDHKTVELGIELAAAVLGGRYDWYSTWMRNQYAAMTGGKKLINI